MGTVGLSFGSPTSGTGFDVSTTVAAIVGNLQNVETPWKNQLSSLEAQDTTISSLGTLFFESLKRSERPDGFPGGHRGEGRLCFGSERDVDYGGQ